MYEIINTQKNNIPKSIKDVGIWKHDYYSFYVILLRMISASFIIYIYKTIIMRL